MSEQNPFATPSTITDTINGTVYSFYAASVGCSFKLKNLAKPIIQAIAVLMSDNLSDNGSIRNEVISGPDSLERNWGHHPISPELAKFRSQERESSLDRLLDALFDEMNRELLCELIVDSLQETFPVRVKGLVRKEDVIGFREKCDMPTFLRMLKNVGLANVEQFGALGKRLTLLAQKSLEGIETRTGSTAPVSNDANLNPTEQPTAVTPG